MQINSHFWSRLSTTDFSQLDAHRAVAVLPLGATEQHGPHLPLSVDTTLVEGVIEAALPHLKRTDPVLFLPTQTLGLSTEHTALVGRMMVKVDELARQEGCRPYPEGGYRLMVNTGQHGGQEVHHLHLHVMGGPRPWSKG